MRPPEQPNSIEPPKVGIRMPGGLVRRPRGMANLRGCDGQDRRRPASRAGGATGALNGLVSAAEFVFEKPASGTRAPGRADSAEMRLNANSPRNCRIDVRQCFAT